jgi:hypothetical protein
MDFLMAIGELMLTCAFHDDSSSDSRTSRRTWFVTFIWIALIAAVVGVAVWIFT